jgi:hypothetical protein
MFMKRLISAQESLGKSLLEMVDMPGNITQNVFRLSYHQRCLHATRTDSCKLRQWNLHRLKTAESSHKMTWEMLYHRDIWMVL